MAYDFDLSKVYALHGSDLANSITPSEEIWIRNNHIPVTTLPYYLNEHRIDTFDSAVTPMLEEIGSRKFPFSEHRASQKRAFDDRMKMGGDYSYAVSLQRLNDAAEELRMKDFLSEGSLTPAERARLDFLDSQMMHLKDKGFSSPEDAVAQYQSLRDWEQYYKTKADNEFAARSLYNAAEAKLNPKGRLTDKETFKRIGENMTPFTYSDGKLTMGVQTPKGDVVSRKVTVSPSELRKMRVLPQQTWLTRFMGIEPHGIKPISVSPSGIQRLLGITAALGGLSYLNKAEAHAYPEGEGYDY